MFISKLNSWLEEVDPYYTQRILLRKGLYLATWLTFINWIARPDAFTAYAMPPILLVALCETANLDTHKQKDTVLAFSFSLSAFTSATFYMLFPFKFYLLFFVLGYYFALYWLCDLFFAKFKPFIVQTIFVGALNLMTTPPASLQIAIDMVFCVCLSMMVTFVALKLHPNLYAEIWYRGFKHFISKIEDDIVSAINRTPLANFTKGVEHLNIIRSYRRLLPKKIMRNAVQVVVSVRNINFALTHIYLIEKNEGFWFNFKQQMHQLVLAIEEKRICQPIIFKYSQEANEKFAQQNLSRAIHTWNKLCSKL